MGAAKYFCPQIAQMIIDNLFYLQPLAKFLTGICVQEAEC